MDHRLYAQLQNCGLDKWPVINKRFDALESLRHSSQSLKELDAVARSLGVSTRTLYRWRHHHLKCKSLAGEMTETSVIDQIVLGALARCGSKAPFSTIYDACLQDAELSGRTAPSRSWLSARIRHLRRDVAGLRERIGPFVVVDQCRLDVSFGDGSRKGKETQFVGAFDLIANKVLAYALLAAGEKHIRFNFSQSVEAEDRLPINVIATKAPHARSALATLKRRAAFKAGGQSDQVKDSLPVTSAITAFFGEAIGGLPVRIQHLDRREPKFALPAELIHSVVATAIDLRNDEARHTRPQNKF